MLPSPSSARQVNSWKVLGFIQLTRLPLQHFRAEFAIADPGVRISSEAGPLWPCG